MDRVSASGAEDRGSSPRGGTRYIPSTIRIARIASILALATSLTIGVVFLFAPLGTECSSGPVSPGQPQPPASCRNVGFFETQRDSLFPALVFVAAWSLAPLLAVAGTWRRPNVALVAIAAALELGGIVSLGGGFLWAITAGPILLVALVLTIVARASTRAH